MTAADPRTPGWLRRLVGYVLRHRRDVAISFAGAVLGAACQAGAPLLERQIVDGVIVERTESLLPWLIALIVVAVGAFLGAHLRRYRGGKVALAVQYDLRNEMQAHLQEMDFAALDRMPTGQLVARAGSDTTLVQGLLMFIPMMSGNLLLMVLSLGVMVVIAHRLQTARSADRIVLLDAGRIAEVGNHQELLTRGGRYAAMWRAFEALTDRRAA